MSRISTGLAVGLLALVFAAPATTASSRPALRVASMQPFVVQGLAFRPGERVGVTALTLIGPRRVLVRASAAGRFAAQFRLPAQPCGSPFALHAVGALGSRVTLRVPSRACVPPPIR